MALERDVRALASAAWPAALERVCDAALKALDAGAPPISIKADAWQALLALADNVRIGTTTACAEDVALAASSVLPPPDASDESHRAEERLIRRTTEALRECPDVRVALALVATEFDLGGVGAPGAVARAIWTQRSPLLHGDCPADAIVELGTALGTLLPIAQLVDDSYPLLDAAPAALLLAACATAAGASDDELVRTVRARPGFAGVGAAAAAQFADALATAALQHGELARTAGRMCASEALSAELIRVGIARMRRLHGVLLQPKVGVEVHARSACDPVLALCCDCAFRFDAAIIAVLPQPRVQLLALPLSLASSLSAQSLVTGVSPRWAAFVDFERSYREKSKRRCVLLPGWGSANIGLHHKGRELRELHASEAGAALLLANWSDAKERAPKRDDALAAAAAWYAQFLQLDGGGPVLDWAAALDALIARRVLAPSRRTRLALHPELLDSSRNLLDVSLVADFGSVSSDRQPKQSAAPRALTHARAAALTRLLKHCKPLALSIEEILERFADQPATGAAAEVRSSWSWDVVRERANALVEREILQVDRDGKYAYCD